MKPQLSQTFGNNLSTYLNASSEQVIYAGQLPETSQTINQLSHRHQSQMWRTASECALHELVI